MQVPSLEGVQADIFAALLHADDARGVQHLCGDPASAVARLRLYRNSARQTLLRALQLTFPAVRHLVGDAFFEQCGEDFVAEHPGNGGWLEDYGAAFGDFLADYAPAAELSYLPDVARLEFLVNQARNAADVPACDFAALAEVDDIAAAGLRFQPHPSLGLLHAAAPVDSIRSAVLSGAEAELAALDTQAGEVWLLVSRGEQGVGVRRLGEAGWRFAAALAGGAQLGHAARWAADGVAELLSAHLLLQDFVDFLPDAGGAP